MNSQESFDLKFKSINPIFKDGEIPEDICINHFYQRCVDLETEKRWEKCYFCGHKTTK